jgi:hypothetical protein
MLTGFGLSLVVKSNNPGQASLDDARARWAARPFDNYQIAIRNSMPPLACDAEYVIVDQTVSQVISTVPSAETCAYSLDTVEQLFSYLESFKAGDCGPNGCDCDGQIRLRVAYHQELGYPLHFESYLYRPVNLFEQLNPFRKSYPCTLVGWIGDDFEVISLTPLH